MTSAYPGCSVVVPSHNRRDALRRTLDALCAQTYPHRHLEVLVVADGCTDGTGPMVQAYQAPFKLHLIEQPGIGAAAARNCGAAAAQGELLLFLDDDIEPSPQLIESHVRVHQRRPDQVVMGPYPPLFQGRLDYYHVALRLWWESKFQAMRRPDHRFSYRDLLGGNLSLEARLFARTGGFDPAFPASGGEDYEFGVRLIEADLTFTYADCALAYHHQVTDLDKSFRRARQEGQADVLIGRRHPHLRSGLRLAGFDAPLRRPNRLLRSLAFSQSAAGTWLAALLRWALDGLERARLRRRWSWLYRALHSYWYWRGVMDELGSRQALVTFLQDDGVDPTGPGPEIEIDLQQGLETAMQRLDSERPAGLLIRYGRQPVGRISPQPGAERLRGVHLPSILATTLAQPLLKAMTRHGAPNGTVETGWLLAAYARHTLAADHTGPEAGTKPRQKLGPLPDWQGAKSGHRQK